MKFKLLCLTATSLILLSCGNSEQKKRDKENVSNEKTLNTETKLEELKIEATRLRAGESIKNVELNSDKATISYVSNFKEYKELNPQSSLTESELKSYWESGDSIEKALIDGSVRIMRKFEFINEVKIILPYNKKTYEISVNKSDLEKFIGTDFKSIIENWNKKFSEPYVYDSNGRQLFFKRFGVRK